MTAPMNTAMAARCAVDQAVRAQRDLAFGARKQDRLVAILGGRAFSLKRPAGSAVFSIGEPALRCYLVVSGMLAIERRGIGGWPSRRLARTGDLVSYNCGDAHAADCQAVVDSVLLVVDRRQLERRTAGDPFLRAWLRDMHARELELLLETLGDGRGPFARARLGRTPVLQTLRGVPPDRGHLRAA